MTPSSVAPSSEVEPVSVEHKGKPALSVQRDPQRDLNSKLEPEISWEGTSSEESRDLHMEEHREEGADWEGENNQDLLPLRSMFGSTGAINVGISTGSLYFNIENSEMASERERRTRRNSTTGTQRATRPGP